MSTPADTLGTMPAVTTPLSFPYPLGSDPVADGDNAIRALAEAVDDYVAGSNALVTYESIAADQLEGTRVMRRGSMVTLRLGIYTNPIGSGATILTVPVGYRPGVVHRFLAMDVATGYAQVPLAIDEAGRLLAAVAIGQARTLTGTVTYPLGPETPGPVAELLPANPDRAEPRDQDDDQDDLEA